MMAVSAVEVVELRRFFGSLLETGMVVSTQGSEGPHHKEFQD